MSDADALHDDMLQLLTSRTYLRCASGHGSHFICLRCETALRLLFHHNSFAHNCHDQRRQLQCASLKTRLDKGLDTWPQRALLSIYKDSGLLQLLNFLISPAEPAADLSALP